MTYEEAMRYRGAIEAASESLTDEEALAAPELFPRWKTDQDYAIGYRLYYNGVLYAVLQNHRSQADWTPDTAASLYAKVLIPGPEIPEWEQPSSTNAYMKGDKVRHFGKVWESLVDNNVWEPGTVGTENLWIEISE